MTNAELIYNLRYCFEKRKTVVGVPWYVWCDRAADALEADDKRIAELENDLMCGTVSEPERFGINGYSMKDLLLFAEMCKRNDVSEADLKKAAWNLELAVRAVMNERAEIVKNTMDEIAMRFTPDFEKAYEEMMQNSGAKMKTVTDCHALEEGEQCQTGLKEH